MHSFIPEHFNFSMFLHTECHSCRNMEMIHADMSSSCRSSSAGRLKMKAFKIKALQGAGFSSLDQSERLLEVSPESLRLQEAGWSLDKTLSSRSIPQRPACPLSSSRPARASSEAATMRLSAHEPCRALLLLLVLLRTCRAFTNDATELLLPHVSPPVPEPSSNASLNRARSGGRAAGGGGAQDGGGEWRSV